MLVFLTVFNIVIAIAAIILGLLPIIRGNQDRRGIAFSFMTFCAAAWTLANFFGSYANEYVAAKILITADFILGIILVNLFWLFARTTRQKITSLEKRRASFDIAMSLLPILSLALILLIIAGKIVVINFDGHLIVRNQTLYWLYPLVIFSIGILAIKDLVIAQIKSRGLQRVQMRLILSGLLIAVLFVVVPNLLLENLLEKGPVLTLAYNSSYLGILVFLLLSGYAIIKHRLFDIRLVVVRSLAYGLSIIALSALYGILTFVVINRIAFRSHEIDLGQQIVYTALAVAMAFLFQPLLNFFNWATQKLFYKNAYKTQEVIDQISSVISGTISSKTIQKDALLILDKAVPTTFTAFLLFDDAGHLARQHAIGERHIDKPDAVILQKLLAGHSKKMIIYDELSDKNGQLKDSLSTLGVEIVVPLATRGDLIGYLLIGDKKSGGTYTNQDIQLFNIAAQQLTVALQNTARFEKIQDFNITLQNKVKEATGQLRSTNRELVTMDEIKDDFINIASHQLRTPLTSVKGYIAMLLDNDFGKLNKNQRKALQEAFTSSQRMVFLIADFLNLSRIKAGRFEIDAQAVSLPQVVSEEITQLQETAHSRQLKLEYKPPEKFPELMLDENKLRQVIMNMIDNAIYYTPKGGNVTVELYASDKEIVFKVKDTGIGVPKSEQHKLFTKFYRAANAQKARPDGTGIGLFLAKKVIIAQGGAIIFESKENSGSTFGFKFPLAALKISS